MLSRIIFWCEFPETVDWQRLETILKQLSMRISIYIPCRTLQQYLWWKKEIKKTTPHIKEVNVWPALSKEEGYWFSGLTKKEDIDLLNKFKGCKMKIDLEPPIPPFNYTNLRIIIYFLKLLFKKGKNTKYLIKTIRQLSKESEVLVNEFPLPKFLLKRWGMYIRPNKKIKKNIMLYSSVAGPLIRPFLRLYNFWYIKKEFKKNKEISGSIGLIGPGILKTERAYASVKEFKADLRAVSKIGLKNVIIYSIDSIMKRREPKFWLKVVRAYTRSPPPHQTHSV